MNPLAPLRRGAALTLTTSLTLTLTLALAPCADAAAEPAPPSRCAGWSEDVAGLAPEALELLLNEDYAGIEGRFNGQLRSYLGGAIDDDRLFQAFDGFRLADARIEPALDAWIRTYPQSYAARLARVHYRIGLAWSARAAQDGGNGDLAGFEAHLRAALPDLQAAVEIDETRPISLLQTMLRMAPWLGMPAEKIDAIRERTLAIDPYSVRTWRIALWGAGQPDEIDRLAAIASSVALSEPQKASIEHMRIRLHGEHLSRGRTGPAAAVPLYQQALAVCETAEVWQLLIRAHASLGQWQPMQAAASRMIRLAPQQAWAWRQLGWVLEKQRKPLEAVAPYEKASALGDTWAQARLGRWMLEGRIVRRDLSRAITLLQSAAAGGNDDARQLLAELDARLRREPQSARAPKAGSIVQGD